MTEDEKLHLHLKNVESVIRRLSISDLETIRSLNFDTNDTHSVDVFNDTIYNTIEEITELWRSLLYIEDHGCQYLNQDPKTRKAFKFVLRWAMSDVIFLAMFQMGGEIITEDYFKKADRWIETITILKNHFQKGQT